MSDVFISYAHEDRQTVERLAERLEAAGLSVWWDLELRAGDDFSRRIEEVLEGAGCVIVLWSRHSVVSRWVNVEATEGLEHGKLIPLSLDGARPPLVFRGLHTVGWPEVESRGAEWDELVGAIHDLIGRPQEPEGRVPVRSGEHGPRQLKPKQLLAILAALASVSVVAIAALQSMHKTTVAELELTLDELSLTVVPESEPPASGTAELLRSQLPVRILRARGADSFEATLAEPRSGRATAEPMATGTVTLAARGGAPPFQPVVRLSRPMRLGLRPSGRDGLTILLDPAGEQLRRSHRIYGDASPGDWQCEVPPREGLELGLRDVELAVGGGRAAATAVRLEPAAKAIVFRGGSRRAELALMPGTADLGSELLAPDLLVAAPSFYRFDSDQRVRSLMIVGRIVFPRGENEPVDLRRGHFLRLPEESRLKLGSLRLANGNLEVVLAGEVSSLKTGPTLGLMNEQLPSLLVWLSTHQLPALVFSALAILTTTALSLLKLLGLLKRD